MAPVRLPKGLTIEFADPPAQSKPSLCNAKAILHEFSDGAITTYLCHIEDRCLFRRAFVA